MNNTTLIIELVLATILILVCILQWREIKNLQKSNTTTISSYEKTLSELYQEKDIIRERGSKNIIVLTTKIEMLDKQLMYARYILKYLNKNWYRALNIYNPEKSNPALRLSVHQSGGYNVNRYIGSADVSLLTDFLIPIGKKNSKLSNLLDLNNINEMPTIGELILMTNQL